MCPGFPGLKDLGYEGYLDVDVTTEPTPVDRSLDLGMRDSGVLYYGNPYTSGRSGGCAAQGYYIGTIGSPGGFS